MLISKLIVTSFICLYVLLPINFEVYWSHQTPTIVTASLTLGRCHLHKVDLFSSQFHVSRVGFSSHIYCCVHYGWHMSIGGILVSQGASSNTLDFHKNLEVSTLFLGVPLWLFTSNIFGGGSEAVRKLDNQFRASWIVWSDQSSQKSPFLPLGWCLLPTTLVWRRSCGLLIPWFPV